MNDFSWTTFLSSLVGGGATAWLMVKGLSSHLADRWLTRYKSELDREFEKYRDMLEQNRKRIEADLGQRTYVSKSQFDTEFDAIKEIFAALRKLRLSFNGLRPFLDWIPDDEESRLQLVSARLGRFKPLLDALITTIEVPIPLYQMKFTNNSRYA